MAKNKQNHTSNVNSWCRRKAQLQTLLDCRGDDEEEGFALDRILHGQTAIGLKSQRSVDIDKLRFSDKDLASFGPLAEAQFGTVELVNCRLDGRVYVRKRVSKKFAIKTREQFSFQTERHILSLALKSRETTSWTPRMLCAYQCPSYLNIVMEYAAGGSLWDVLESSTEGKLSATDLSWWAPQCVAAISWLHSRAGFAHRDIKPHNFVVRPGPDSRLLLIDFGSAAQLLAPDHEGVQRVPRQNCLVPCGTCDYISPEVLQAHEEALVALEMTDGGSVNDSDVELHAAWKGRGKILHEGAGYGRETDWWSLGAMLYELAYGVAPFFANDIRQTYARIMNHENHLRFDSKIPIPPSLANLLKCLLTDHEKRLGRHSSEDVRNHAYFKGINWTKLHTRTAPPDLLLPQFTYNTPLVPPESEEGSDTSGEVSKPFAFSVLFQSSSVYSPGKTFLSQNQTIPETPGPAISRRSFSNSNFGSVTDSARKSVASFIGFSWGPPKDAFDDATRIVPAEPASAEPGLDQCVPSFYAEADAKISSQQYPLVTPKKPSKGGMTGAVPPSTVRVTSVRRSAQSRPVSDREAMRMLVDCVGMSARKRVLESGKKPKILPQFGVGFAPPPPIMNMGGFTGDDSTSGKFGTARGLYHTRSASCSRSEPRSSVITSVRKELRFDDTTTQILPPNLSSSNTFSNTLSRTSSSTTSSSINHNSLNGNGGQYVTAPPLYSGSDSAMSSETEAGPPSPSPSPRPGSAMSMLSISRRSATPTVSSTYMVSGSTSSGFVRSNSEPPDLRRTRSGSLGSFNAMAPMGSAAVMAGAAAISRATSDSRPRQDRDQEQQRQKQEQVCKTPARRARFADSTAGPSNDVQAKSKAPGTPYPVRNGVTMAMSPPRASKNQAKNAVPAATPKPKREARFDLMTPRPKLGARFVDKEDDIDDDVGEDDGGLEDGYERTPKPGSKQRLQPASRTRGTPHPSRNSKIRPVAEATSGATATTTVVPRTAKTKERMDPVSSTPAHAGVRRKKVDADEEGEEAIGRGNRSRSNSGSGSGREQNKRLPRRRGGDDEDVEKELNRLGTEAHPRNEESSRARSERERQRERVDRNAGRDNRGGRGGERFVDQTYEEEDFDNMLDLMERRYEVLRADLSRVEVQLQKVAARAQVLS